MRALTHRSWCSEHPGEPSNERLEFLGDAVLQLVVTHHIFIRFPDLAEGKLAKIRASVVSAAALAEVAAELRIGEQLRLGRGEDRTGGRMKVSILADALEATIGAIYLDSGFDVASEFVLDRFRCRIAEAAAHPGEADYKSRLQETVTSGGHPPPVYQLEEFGPENRKRFRATVLVDHRSVGRGDGRSKKEAEQRAAKAACDASTEVASDNSRESVPTTRSGRNR